MSSGIWDKPGALTRSEREQVRLHPYHTERILACSPVLAPLGRIAGLHHERLDGSGYHHGLAAAAIPIAARVLAAADTFQTLTQDRPHRAAHTPGSGRGAAGRGGAGRAARHGLRAGRGRGRGAGPGTGPRPAGRAGSATGRWRCCGWWRGGCRTRRSRQTLVISRRTAEHHVQHVYAKIGTSTRAAAALFAMEHDLLPR